MKLSYDLYYLRNANLLLDLLILFKTMRLVAGARGAVPLDGASPLPAVADTAPTTRPVAPGPGTTAPGSLPRQRP
jgi:hypothetical protein